MIPQGYKVAKERDEESRGQYSGGSRSGAAFTREGPSYTLQPWSQIHQALNEFNMMAQYRSHKSETIPDMEDYLYKFHHMKNIFLEYRVTKRTQKTIDEQQGEL